MTSLAQNILEKFQKVSEPENSKNSKNSNSDENINSLFYNGKEIEKEIQTEQTGEFPSWISGKGFSDLGRRPQIPGLTGWSVELTLKRTYVSKWPGKIRYW